jgi:hypothetical protein
MFVVTTYERKKSATIFPRGDCRQQLLVLHYLDRDADVLVDWFAQRAEGPSGSAPEATPPV